MQATSVCFLALPQVCEYLPHLSCYPSCLCFDVLKSNNTFSKAVYFKHCSMLGPGCPPFNVQYALGPSQSDFAQVFAVYSLSRTLHGLTLSQLLHKQKCVQFTVAQKYVQFTVVQKYVQFTVVQKYVQFAVVQKYVQFTVLHTVCTFSILG